MFGVRNMGGIFGLLFGKQQDLLQALLHLDARARLPPLHVDGVRWL